MAKNKHFQISTAIDYPSSRFHLGHAYEKIVTDILARWQRINGNKVHFSTGTDCHGLKIQRAAEKAKKDPEKFVKEISEGFRELCTILNISYDDFIMTIEGRHKKIATEIIKKLDKNKDIYKGTYEGLYCVDCETYYTEKELDSDKCPVHKKAIEILKEESYFFKLSKYQNFLIKHIEKNKDSIWPEKKRKEILNRLKEPLKDLSITRKQVSWGIPFPLDKKLTTFVWIEALINYLSTVDYPNKKFQEFWPAIHIIGSDIVWHHTAIWFSILKSLDLDMPKVIVHGFINLKGEKLSKAKGITVDPIELSNKYGEDALRYFLIREIPFGDDGDFSEDALKKRLNNELANDLGNLLSRTLSMVNKYFHGNIPKGKNELSFNINNIRKLMENYELHTTLAEIWKHVREVNKYLNERKPWENEKERDTIIYSALDSLRIVSILLYPFIPSSIDKINAHLGIELGTIKDCKPDLLEAGKIKMPDSLFKKIEED